MKGEANQQDYGMRIYDPRLGRFLSVDPLANKFPWNTPYAFAENDVIRSIDMDGLEKTVMTTKFSVSNGTLSSSTTSDINKGAQQFFRTGQRTAKQIIAESMVRGMSGFNPPKDGVFVFWEFEQNPERNYASYYVKQNDGNVHTYEYSPEVVVMFNDLLPAAEIDAENFERIGASLVNLIAAGSLAKAELKEAATELKAETSEITPGTKAQSRPNWQQSEADIVTSDYTAQQSFKNGNLVPKFTKGSVRPEGYKFGFSLEVKNYDLRTNKGIKDMMSNVLGQVRKRQTNLPSNTVQNITLDVRGQNLTAKQLMDIRSRLTTQTGTKNINVSFKTD